MKLNSLGERKFFTENECLMQSSKANNQDYVYKQLDENNDESVNYLQLDYTIL